MKKGTRKGLSILLLVCLISGVVLPVSTVSASDTCTIQATANDGGVISPSGETVLAKGQSQTYTFTPDYGYVIADVVVDNESQGVMNAYTFHEVEEGHKISVVFARRSSDLNENGFCDEEDIATVREGLLQDDSLSIVDYVRAMRQKTLWGNALEDADSWTLLGDGKYQISDGTATFDTSASILANENFGSDYSVSATVTMMEDTSSTTDSIGLMARREGSTYYDYRLFYISGAFELRLNRYVKGTETTLLASYTESHIQNTIGYQALAIEKPLQLRMTCVGDSIYCYVNNCLIGTYQDLDASAPKTGCVGIKASNTIASVAGFEVQSITALSIDSVNEESLAVYEGGSVYESVETVQAVCVDGTLLTTDMRHAKLTGFDNEKVGEQTVSMSLLGEDIPVTLCVKERRAEIAKISAELEDDATDEVLKQFLMLSEYEQSLCSEEAVSNYHKAIQANAMAISSTKDTVLLQNACENQQVTWSSGVEIQRGKAFEEVGRYCIEQTSYGLSGNCWRTVEDLHGEIHSVSADMVATSVNTAVGLTLNVGTNGYYYARVLFSVGEDGQKAEPTIRLYRKASDAITLDKDTLSASGIYLNPEEWFHMSLTDQENVIKVYINGTEVLSYDDSAAVEQFTTGSAGVYSGYGNSKFDNFIVCGEAIEKTASSMQPVSTAYENDFEQETVGETATGWVQEITDTTWSVMESTDGSNQFYGVTATEYAGAKLHVHEKNPTVALDFMYKELSGAESDFGFEIRKSGETAYVRIGYDKTEGKWYLKESMCDVECDAFEYEAKGSLTENEWHTAQIVAEGAELVFTVDGQTIFDLSNISQTGFGRIGVYANGCACFIDNVSCRFPSGDTVQSGVLEYFLDDDDDYAASFEIESLEGGNMIGVGYNVIAVSDDYGETFTKVTDDAYAALDAGGAYASMIQLHDGSYLFIKQKDFEVLRSDGDMTFWEKIGTVETALVDDYNRRLSIIHTNSLTEVYLEEEEVWRIFLPVGMGIYDDETTRDVDDHYTCVWYSDDGGVTWNCSENDTRDSATLLPEGQSNADWCEAKIIKCADGKLRMYCSRNEYGSMLYTTSSDGGKTWSGMTPVPELQCAKSSFSIIEDGSNTGVYYMVWVNDNPLYTGNIVGRSRLSLARSTDGVNWEFLCDVERNSPYVWSNDMTVTSPVFQIVDPSIEVTDDYVYISYGTSDRTLEHDNGYHNAQQIKVVRIKKSELTAKEWNAYTLSDVTCTKSVALTRMKDRSYVVGEEFDYAGGVITLTAFDGTTTGIPTENFYLLQEPDMSVIGEQEVILYNRNGFTIRYMIEISKNGYGEIF